MRVNGDILNSSIWKNYEINMFSYFGYGFKIKASVMHEHVMNNQEHMNNIQAHSSNLNNPLA